MATIFPATAVNNQIVNKAGQSWRYNATEDSWVKVSGRQESSGSVNSPLFGAFDIREDIFGAWSNNTGILQQYGGTSLTDTTTYATSTWNGDNIMRWGNTATSVAVGPGLRLDVPAGYDMVWLRRHQSDGDVEMKILYAWNNQTNTSYEVTNWGNRGMGSHLTPSGITKGRQFTTNTNAWTSPLYLPDRNGGTIFMVATTTTGTRDQWIGGLAFSRNDRHLTMTNAITSWRGSFGGNTGGTFTGNDAGQPSINRDAISGTNKITEIQRAGMYCINSTGGDKILVVVGPQGTDGSQFGCRHTLEISGTGVNAGNTVVLAQPETGGVDMNPVAEGMFHSRYTRNITISYRIPAEAVNAVTFIGDAPQEVRFRFLSGESNQSNFVWQSMYLFDA